jgi:hypothetical protein
MISLKENNLESILATYPSCRGELKSFKWAISNQVTNKKLKNCKITPALQSILVQAACYGRENVPKWALDLGILVMSFLLLLRLIAIN